MTRGGPRPGSGRPKAKDPRRAVAVYLTRREHGAAMAALEPHETWQDFAREALAELVRARGGSGKAAGFWHIRVTEAVRAEVAAAAKAAGVKESAFIRDAALKEARTPTPSQAVRDARASWLHQPQRNER